MFFGATGGSGRSGPQSAGWQLENGWEQLPLVLTQPAIVLFPARVTRQHYQCDRSGRVSS